MSWRSSTCSCVGDGPWGYEGRLCMTWRERNKDVVVEAEVESGSLTIVGA